MIYCPYCNHEAEPPVCKHCKAAVPIVVYNTEEKSSEDENNKEDE